MQFRTFDSREKMSREAAAFTRELIVSKVGSGHTFTIALSGGSSPVRFYELLSEEKIDWSGVKVFLVDERYVPADHEFSNFNMVNNVLLSKIDIPEINIFSFNTSIEPVSKCASEYEGRVRMAFGNNYPRFDLVVLGVGPDGHTASLFPGNRDFLNEKDLFIASEAPSGFDISERLTMTLPLINSASGRIFVIAGKGKDSMVQRILNRDSSIPAGQVNSKSIVFYDHHLLRDKKAL